MSDWINLGTAWVLRRDVCAVYENERAPKSWDASSVRTIVGGIERIYTTKLSPAEVMRLIEDPVPVVKEHDPISWKPIVDTFQQREEIRKLREDNALLAAKKSRLDARLHDARHERGEARKQRQKSDVEVCAQRQTVKQLQVGLRELRLERDELRDTLKSRVADRDRWHELCSLGGDYQRNVPPVPPVEKREGDCSEDEGPDADRDDPSDRDPFDFFGPGAYARSEGPVGEVSGGGRGDGSKDSDSG